MTKLEMLTGPVSLDSEEQEALTEILFVVDDTLSTVHDTRTDDFVSRQPYTAVALAEIASWLRIHDDNVGADMLEAFTREFARHEATLV